MLQFLKKINKLHREPIRMYVIISKQINNLHMELLIIFIIFYLILKSVTFVGLIPYLASFTLLFPYLAPF